MDVLQFGVRLMGSLLDIVNTVRIQNMSDMNRVNNARHELESRAQDMEEEFGVRLPNFYRFNRDNPSREKAQGPFGRIVSWTLSSLLIGAVVGAVLMGIGVAMAPAGAAIPVAQIAHGAGLIGIASLFVGIVGGLSQDDKPHLDRQQTERYAAFLDKAEQELTLARDRGMLPTRQENRAPHPAHGKAPTHYRDLVQMQQADMFMQQPQRG